MTRLSSLAIFATASALALSACAREDEAPAANDAGNAALANSAAGNAMMPGGAAAGGAAQSFNFAGGDGKALGSVSVSQGAGGLAMTITATGMPAGTHGLHLHEKGLCEGPKFESAGAHWNPASKKHGRDNAQGAHLGDLANIEIGADGSATTTLGAPGVMMTSGANMIADADGTSLVVHAKADDYKTDPSGDSGDRIACAVLAPPK